MTSQFSSPYSRKSLIMMSFCPLLPGVSCFKWDLCTWAESVYPSFQAELQSLYLLCAHFVKPQRWRVTSSDNCLYVFQSQVQHDEVRSSTTGADLLYSSLPSKTQSLLYCHSFKNQGQRVTSCEKCLVPDPKCIILDLWTAHMELNPHTTAFHAQPYSVAPLIPSSEASWPEVLQFIQLSALWSRVHHAMYRICRSGVSSVSPASHL